MLQEYRCKSVINNAMQVANQFKHLQNKYKRAFLFKDFQDLNENRLLSLEYNIQNALKSKSYKEAVKQFLLI